MTRHSPYQYIIWNKQPCSDFQEEVGGPPVSPLRPGINVKVSFFVVNTCLSIA